MIKRGDIFTCLVNGGLETDPPTHIEGWPSCLLGVANMYRVVGGFTLENGVIYQPIYACDTVATMHLPFELTDAELPAVGGENPWADDKQRLRIKWRFGSQEQFQFFLILQRIV